MSEELINKVESIKLMLVSRATGGDPDNNEYKELRRDLIATPSISKMLPRFIHICRDLSEFWNFIKPKFASYYARREYLRNEFDALLTMLETKNHPPSDAAISATVHAVNSTYIQEVWQKALERRSADPEGVENS